MWSACAGMRGRPVAERIKDTLDPHGILSPGKQGIWPAAYRSKD